MNKITPVSSAITDGKHLWPIRVYYEDTDAGEVVYYANYLKYAERARTEMLHELGIGQQSTKEEHGVGFVVKHCNADYRKPARLDDQLVVETEVRRLGRASIELLQTVKKEDETLVVMDIKLACFDFSTARSVRLPEKIGAAIENLIVLRSED